MNTDEQLALWLGWKKDWRGWWMPISKDSMRNVGELPDFRASNEWAGALLEKFQQSGIQIELSWVTGKDGYLGGGPAWDVHISHPVPLSIDRIIHGATWRDAVVDAALEVIGRSGNGSGE